MRTTLTLDPDFQALLERARQETGEPLKALVNNALRRGLTKPPQPTANQQFQLPSPLQLGQSRLPSLDKIHEVIGLLDDDPR